MLKSLILAGLLALAPLSAHAQEAKSCQSVEQFSKAVHDADASYDLVILTGTPLETFAANMDKLSGGGHGPMDGLVFKNPEGNDADITVIAVFRGGCYIGNAEVPTQMIKKALGQGV